MDDVPELPAEEAADDIRSVRLMPYLSAAAMALLSVVMWWGVRSNEVQQAEMLQRQQVESERVVLQDRLEQVERSFDQIEAGIAVDGVESEDTRTAIDEQASRFTQFAIIQSSGADRLTLAFAADDFRPFADAVDAGAVFDESRSGTSVVSEVSNASTMVAISKPLPALDQNDSQPSTAVVAVVSLTSRSVAGELASSSNPRFIVEVDGSQITTDNGESGTNPSAERVVFQVGARQWSITPVGTTTTASHLGSNVLWAAGVALTTLVFLIQRRHRTDSETHDELLHSFYRLTDPVTGFLNAEGVQKELDTRIKRRHRGGQVGVLLCNIDRYESIKKGLGPSMADDVIRMTFARIQSLLGGSDSCGRFGESQVLVMSNGLPAVNDLENLAQEICREFADPLELSDGTICHISFTIGIALTRSSDTSAASLLSDVSSAQSAAVKHGGTNYFVFSEEQRLEEAVRSDLVNELLGAVRNHELTVHYQPVVRVGAAADDTLPVDKVEAFVRWPHPVRGMVHPGVFLPLAVEAGVDLKVAEMVLTDACQHALVWSELAGRPITVVVNVGERQLVDLRLVGVVREVLRGTGLAAHQLELDIPEELLLRTNVGTQEVMQQLTRAGVKISLDDFGASSGSLQKLAAATIISTVKIDQAFVDDIATNEVNQKVISAVVSMAQQCEISVVAEGVETIAQVEALYQLGVKELQGFFFNRPGAAETISDQLEEGPLVHLSHETNPHTR